DKVTVDPDLRLKLEMYLVRGGCIISSGHSGLTPEATSFALDEWNMLYEGEDTWNSSYFKMVTNTEGEIPDRLWGIRNQAILLQIKDGSSAVADYYQPYFNREWDGFHGKF